MTCLCNRKPALARAAASSSALVSNTKTRMCGKPAQTTLAALQHVLPDTNAGNWAKKGHNATASEVASYRFEGDAAWHALRKRFNGKPPPVIFASQLVNVYGHFFRHCRTLLSDAAVMERLAVGARRSGPLRPPWSPTCCKGDPAHGLCATFACLRALALFAACA